MPQKYSNPVGGPMPLERDRTKIMKDIICFYKLFGLILNALGRYFRILIRGVNVSDMYMRCITVSCSLEEWMGKPTVLSRNREEMDLSYLLTD